MKLLGEILCKTAGLTQAQLKHALQEQRQKKNDSPLGRILMKHGYITEEQLKEAVALQKKMADKITSRRRYVTLQSELDTS